MVKKWLHLNFEVGNPWGYPIVTAMSAAIAAGKVQPVKSKLGQMPLHITTRLDMLPRVIRRINEECDALYKLIKMHGPQHVSTLGHKASVYRVDEELKYNLLVDIDSFMFEINACCDLIINLIRMVSNHIGNSGMKKNLRIIVKTIIANSGKDPTWLDELDSNRNVFIHNAAPYIAIDLSEEENEKYDLLIMKENLHEFSDESKFIRLSKLNEIWIGFRKAMPVLQKYIVSLYD